MEELDDIRLARFILDILPEGEHVKIAAIAGGYEITYGKMYDAPPLNLDTLMRLSDLFGTTSIDVDRYSQGGCDTCDWGSDYGHTIQIYKPTKQLGGMELLNGKDLYKLKESRQWSDVIFSRP